MSKSRKILPKTTAIIESLGTSEILENPLFAINWFNTRAAWLYAFYNFLAAGPLKKSGGKALIKASFKKTIYGDQEAARKFLLIVHYPSADHFLDLLANKFFQTISILRVMAVKDFSFVLSTRADGGGKTEPLKSDKIKSYGVHHFHSDADFTKELKKIHKLIQGSDASIYFASQSTAKVIIRQDNEEGQEMSFITQKIVLLEAGTDSEIEKLVMGTAFQKFISGTDTSYIGLFSRVL